MTQGVAVMVGAQDKFSWRGVAAATAGAYASSKLTDSIMGDPTRDAAGNVISRAGGLVGAMGGDELAKLGGASLLGFTAGITAAAARGGKVSVKQVATDAFGNALGDSLADAAGQRGSSGIASPQEDVLGAFIEMNDGWSGVSTEPVEDRVALTTGADSDVPQLKSSLPSYVAEYGKGWERQGGRYVTVKSGDTMSGLGGGFTGAGAIAMANNRSNGDLAVGETIWVPEAGSYNVDSARETAAAVYSASQRTRTTPVSADPVSVSSSGPVAGATLVASPGAETPRLGLKDLLRMGMERPSSSDYTAEQWNSLAEQYKSLTKQPGEVWTRDGIYNGFKANAAQAGVLEGMPVLSRDNTNQMSGVLVESGNAAGIGVATGVVASRLGGRVGSSVRLTASGNPVLAEVEYGTNIDQLVESAKPSMKGKLVVSHQYENPGHHDPSASGTIRYNSGKSVLPADHVQLFERSSPFVSGDGTVLRWVNDGAGNIHRFEPTLPNVYHWSGSTNGVTASGRPRPLVVPPDVARALNGK
jgi:hypothetical protein